MKANRLASAWLAIGLGLITMTQAADVLADKGNKPKKGEEVVAAEPPDAKKGITLPIAGLAWGMSPKKVAEVIDKILDDDYRPLYKDTQPGVKMKALDAQLAEEKDQFRRSRIDFGKIPTGIDSTPLRGEYTYQNKEAMLSLTRQGETSYFFFIQERLWKVIVEVKLNDKSPLGKTFTEAAVKLSTQYGIPGRVLQPDANRASVEVDWKDANTHLRAIQRSDTALALAYEDLGTLANLSALRSFKPVEDNGIDPDVAAAIRGKAPEPPPPPPKDDKKKPKK
ncbi:MAG: hypothetical protein U0359_29185 [Byssovorax sp.]